jgi:hypothetical protein
MKNEILSYLSKSMRIALLVAVAIGAVAAGVAEPAQDNVTSYWSGTTQAQCGSAVTDRTRCNAVQNITLTLIPEGAKIAGTYICAFGTQNCRGLQETGTIVDGSLNGNQLAIAVQMPDGSTCRFSGVLSGDSGKGGYTCKGGKRPIERGSWRVLRTTKKGAASAPRAPSMLRPSGS